MIADVVGLVVSLWDTVITVVVGLVVSLWDT